MGLLAAQTAAALILFWIVFPIFHGLVTHLGERQMLALSDQVGIVASAALLHCCYWTRLKWVPATLFGLFCYSLDLDRFGKAVEDRPPGRSE
ncbi:hypothetical protein HFN98_16800 [Rhizobium laguerreae]|nr:hypothetical protein [Rhizobium laguerreae]